MYFCLKRERVGGREPWKMSFCLKGERVGEGKGALEMSSFFFENKLALENVFWL